MNLCRNFLSHSAEKKAEECFSVSFNFGNGKNLCIKRACHDYFSKFISHCAENNCRGIFNVSLISVIEKIYALEGLVMIFCRNFLSHSTKTFHRDTLLCFRNFLVSKKLMDEMGG